MRAVAIAFSDIHLHTWLKPNTQDNKTRLSLIISNVLDEIVKEAEKLHVPILFSGDLIHDPKGISNVVLDTFTEFLSGLRKRRVLIYGIDGNHDQASREPQGASYLKSLSRLCPNLICVNFTSENVAPGINVHGVPYVPKNKGLRGYIKGLKLSKTNRNILLLHTDLPGAVDAHNFSIDEVENFKFSYLKEFDLVLCGHIHRPQKFLNGRVVMMGSPYQQTRGERGLDLGYWVIYDTGKGLKAIQRQLNMPRFIEVDQAKYLELVKKDPFNFYIPISSTPTLKDLDLGQTNFDPKLGNKKLAKRYLKKLGIDDREKKQALIKYLDK